MSTFMQFQKLAGMFNSSPARPEKLEGDNKIVDLASGFSTYHNNDFYITGDSESNNEAELARRMTLSKSIAKETSGYSYSLSTETLFDLFNNEISIIRDFDFREQIYKELFNNLANLPLMYFYKTQLENDYLTKMHFLYLKETLQLLTREIPRRLTSNEAWTTLLYHSRGDFSKTKVDMRTLTNEAFYYPVLTSSLVELIPSWCTTYAGIVDLIFFLKLVFGRPDLGRLQ